MKSLLFILLFFVSFSAFSQQPTGSFTKPNNSRGITYNGVMAEKEIYFPIYDTMFTPLRQGAITRRPQDTLAGNNIFYTWIGYKWTAIDIVGSGGTTGSGLRKVYSGLWLLNTNDSTIKSDSAAMAAYFLRRKDSGVNYVTPFQLGGYVPMSTYDGDYYNEIITTYPDEGVRIKNRTVDNSALGDFLFSKDGFRVSIPDGGGRGIRGEQNFSDNYDDFTYVQRIYTDKNLDTLYRSGDSLIVFKKNGMRWGIYSPTSTGGGGTGTVSTLSVTTANGISGTVANASTTPAITLNLDSTRWTSRERLTASKDSVQANVTAEVTARTAADLTKFNKSGDSTSYVWFPNQVTPTVSPANGITEFDSSGRLHVRTALGKTYSISTALITANTSVIDSLPNKSGTIAMTSDVALKENALGNPSVNGYVLSSTTGGTRSWVAQSGGGSVSGLTAKPVLFGAANGTIQQVATVAVDSLPFNTWMLRSGAITSSDWTGKQIVFAGNSITLGVGATNNYYRFSSVAMRDLAGFGLVENNIGVSGSVVSNASRALIPVKTSSMVAMNIAFGINEATGYTRTQVVSEYKQYLDTCIARGWQPSELILNTIAGTDAGYSTTFVTPMTDINTIIDSLHTVYGTGFLDCWNPLLLPEYSYISKVNLHPDDNGHQILGYLVAGAIKGNFLLSNQKMAVNGPTQLSELTLKNYNYLTRSHMVAVDSTGKFGITRLLEPDFGARGRFWLNGAVIQRGAVLPTGYDSTIDIVVKPGAKFSSAVSSSVYSYIQLMGPGANGNSSYGNTYATGSQNFYASGGTNGGSTLAMSIPSTGIVAFPLGATITYPSILAQNTSSGNAQLTFIEATTLNTFLSNRAATGGFELRMSDGTLNGTAVNMFRLQPNGRLTLQKGGTFTDVNMSRHTVNSTTEGVLTPRVTTAQRNLIKGAISVTQTNAGSGQTPGSYSLIVSGATTGSGATFGNVTVNGSGVASTLPSITNSGNGYSGTVTATIASGGTPATFAITLGAPEGLEVYDTDLHCKMVYNATRWVQMGTVYMTTTIRTGYSAWIGMRVYDTDTNIEYVFNGTSWNATY